MAGASFNTLQSFLRTQRFAKMKLVFLSVLLISLALVQPGALENPEETNALTIHERGVMNILQKILPLDELKAIVHQVFQLFGADETFNQCNGVCTTGLKKVHIIVPLHLGCDMICGSMQSLIRRFDVFGPKAPVSSSDAATTLDRRSFDILGFLNNIFPIDEIKAILVQTVHLFGADATEQNCEHVCERATTHNGSLLHMERGCDFLCGSMQSLIHRLDILVNPNVHARSIDLPGILGSILPLDEIKAVVHQVFALFGADATEANCEHVCTTNVFSNSSSSLIPFHLACDMICSSLQSLMHRFDLVINPTTPATSVQRKSIDIGGILGSILPLDEIKAVVHQVFALFGADATEANCEHVCTTNVFSNSSSSLIPFHLACDMICSSLQSLMHRFDLVINPTTPATSVQRRRIDIGGILGSILPLDEIKAVVHQVFALFGADATEANCERVCTTNVFSNSSNSLIPFHLACDMICTSLQSLMHKFDLIVTPTTGTQADEILLDLHERSFLDSLLSFLPLDEIKAITHQVFVLFGADATEANCEGVCMRSVNATHIPIPLHMGCDFVCRSIQSLMHRFDVFGATTIAP
ncbi:hypothetical protein ScPMuIL_016182 [Solemya velum]